MTYVYYIFDIVVADGQGVDILVIQKYQGFSTKAEALKFNSTIYIRKTFNIQNHSSGKNVCHITKYSDRCIPSMTKAIKNVVMMNWLS